MKNSSITNTQPSLTIGSVNSSSLKRKRPPKIDIPNVLREIKIDTNENSTPVTSFNGDGVGVFSIKGKKKFMEDTHKIASLSHGNTKKDFFGVYDGHGGKKAAEFVADNLHINILKMIKDHPESAMKEAVKEGYLLTDQEFLKQGLGSGACCVTALIEGTDIVVSNLGDCRAVLCRNGVAEALTKDHRAGHEDERQRIENKGGFVEIHRGAWRVHGILAVSRSIGDAHLKDWVMAEPDTKILRLAPDMEFLVLASDGLWNEVGNQEAAEIVKQVYMDCKKGNLWKEDGCPSSKFRRISVMKPQKKIADKFGSENDSPLSMAKRRISMFDGENIEMPEAISTDKKPVAADSLLVAACKELASLAVRKGGMDDVTVMIIDLNQF